MRISIPRENPATIKFGEYLSSIGHDVEFSPRITAKNFRDFVAGWSDGLLFLWSGHWRKTVANRWKRRPELAYMECGFLPHYDSITIDPVGTWSESSVHTFPLEKLNPAPSAIPDMERPYWLYAAQLEQDSVIHYDCPDSRRSVAQNVRWLLSILPPDRRLIVKLHPRERQEHDLPNFPQIEYMRGFTSPEENRALLRGCTAFIAVNSSMVYEAIDAGCQNIRMLGQGVFTGHMDNPAGLLHELTHYRQLTNWCTFPDCERVWNRFLQEHERIWKIGNG